MTITRKLQIVVKADTLKECNEILRVIKEVLTTSMTKVEICKNAKKTRTRRRSG
jgi:hypothetical protein